MEPKIIWKEVEERHWQLAREQLPKENKRARNLGQEHSEFMRMDPEEAIYTLLGETFFDNRDSGLRLVQALPWAIVNDADYTDLGMRLRKFFQTKPLFGDHRRYIPVHRAFRDRMDQYALECIQSWKNAVKHCGGQKQLIGLGQHETWAELWGRLGEVKPPFHQRLPRWDFLDHASRLWPDLPEPDGMYIDGAGPEKGLTWLFFGDSIPKMEGRRSFRQHHAGILADWNDGVSAKMQLDDGVTYEHFRDALERWTIDFVRRNGDCSIVSDRYFLFDLESCICDIQKGENTQKGK